MKRELKIGDSQIVTIENGIVSIPQSGEVRMKAFEIAVLFDIYTQTVNSHIKAVLKSGVINMDASQSAIVTGNTIMPDVYGLDMITAIAFRVHTPQAGVFREWIFQRMITHFNPLPPTLFIQLPKDALAN